MIVGLTGGIGSGKTYVAQLFENLGVPIYIADVEAKKIMNANNEVKKAISVLFGNEAYQNGTLNRKYIAHQVFTNKVLLNKLNAIVHPAVANHFEAWYKAQNCDFVIKESAILFETGGDKKCDHTILVIAPKNIRIQRVMDRDNITEKEVIERMKNQWDDGKKIKLASYIIENIDSFYVKKQVKKIFLTLNDDFV